MRRRYFTHAAAALIVAAVLPAAKVSAQDPCTRRAIESGFSYCPPDGWTVQADEQQKFKIYIAPQTPPFTPNVNFREAEDARVLSDWVAINVKTILDDPKKFGAASASVAGQTAFATTSGERGVRVAMDIGTERFSVRAYQYYFTSTGTKKLLGSCMGLMSLSTLESTCDRMFRTFRLDP